MITESETKAVRVRLRSASDCSIFLARVIRLTYGGKMDSAEMSRYANAIQVLSRILVDSTLEDRVAALEKGTAP